MEETIAAIFPDVFSCRAAAVFIQLQEEGIDPHDI